MRIWIDLINTPQVSFFVPFINELKNENEFVITCRDSGNTVDLLKQNNIDFHVIGKKTGSEKQYLSFPKRVLDLYSYIKGKKIDVAASQSSFYQPIVSKMLGIPCLYTNDNEHAKGNKFGFLFATRVILPVALKNETFTSKWPLRSKLSFYPSVKEAIYLSQNPALLKIRDAEKTKIYIRPEPWTAQYYKGPVNFIDDILTGLLKDYQVVVLPRDKNQADHYEQSKFKGLTVARKPLSLAEIIADCLFFIGAGGSMTRELAVMGIPVVSIYQADLLCVDKYLIDEGYMMVNPSITSQDIKDMLGAKMELATAGSELENGKKSYAMIKDLVLNLRKK